MIPGRGGNTHFPGMDFLTLFSDPDLLGDPGSLQHSLHLAGFIATGWMMSLLSLVRFVISDFRIGLFTGGTIAFCIVGQLLLIGNGPAGIVIALSVGVSAWLQAALGTYLPLVWRMAIAVATIAVAMALQTEGGSAVALVITFCFMRISEAIRSYALLRLVSISNCIAWLYYSTSVGSDFIFVAHVAALASSVAGLVWYNFALADRIARLRTPVAPAAGTARAPAGASLGDDT